MALSGERLQWVTAVPDLVRRGQAGRGRICRVLAVSRAGKLQKNPCNAWKLHPALGTRMSVTLSLHHGERMEHKHELNGSPGFALGALAAPEQCCLVLPASHVGPAAPETAGVASLFCVRGQPGSLPSLRRGEAAVPGEMSHDFSRAVA